jgi:hypothetical protein
MYYNRILRVWVLDPLDYFLISAFVGSLLASHLKKYLSEKSSMERLKNSIINKSNLATKTSTLILNSKKEKKRKKIYRFALKYRGGQFEEYQADLEFANEFFKLAQDIETLVKRLAAFLKERELKAVVKIFFRSGRLILELILFTCKINISYLPLYEGLNTQVIVITSTVGGAAGFTLSWFSVGASLVAPPLLISALFLRSVTQQFLNQREYSNFKRMVNEMLNDDKLKETIQAFFMEGEGLTPSSGGLEMKPVDFNEISALKYDFNLKSDDNLEEFIKARMQEELGLIENPTERQLEEIIHRKVKRKPKGKTVFFGDFIDKMPYEGADLSDSDIIDTEILEEPIRIKLDDEF